MSDRPNILFFMTDQQRADTVPPFGRAITPNLDAFSAEATAFSDTVCIAPHCCPSRTTMFSGLYPSQHGVWNNVEVGNAISRGMAAGVRLWPQDLADAGYSLYFSGKWHLSAEESPADFGFTVLHDGKSYTGVTDAKTARLPRTYEWKQYDGADIVRGDEERGAGEILRPGYPRYSLYGECDTNKGDEATVSAVEKLLAEKPDGPWFTFCGPTGPHDPYFVPQRFLDLYDIDSIDLPANYADRMEDKPAFYRKTRRPFDQLSEQETREGIRHYLAFCSYEDWLFGRVLDTLRRSGQYDNTVIVYCSDHGDYAGEHGLWAKGLPPFRSAYHVPMLVRVPGAEGGRVLDVPACLADIGPTLLEICGVEPKESRGFARSLCRAVTGSGAELPKREYRFTMTNGNEQYGIQRIVWGKKWKYVYNGFDEDELYDLENDPGETHNAAADPANRGVIREMCEVMWNFVRESDDTILNAYILSAHAPFGPGISRQGKR